MCTQILIQKLEETDILTIVDIHKRCVLNINAKYYPQDVINEWVETINVANVYSQLNNSEWYVIKNDSTIVGFCQFDSVTGEIYQIQIDPDFQNKGYGKKLFYFILTQLRDSKVQRVFLNSTLNAVPFYKSLGLRTLETISFKLDKTSVGMVKMEKVMSETMVDLKR